MGQNSNELKHYGVIGMRWGLRRYQPYSTTGPRKSGQGGKEVGEAARNKVASKSLNKLSKLDSRSQKLKNRNAKNVAKLNSAQAKMNVTQAKISKNVSKQLTAKRVGKILGSESISARATKLQGKNTRQTAKLNKQRAQVSKLQSKVSKGTSDLVKTNEKAKKWVESMNKYIGSEPVSGLSERQKAIGKKYAIDFIKQSSGSSTYGSGSQPYQHSNSSASSSAYGSGSQAYQRKKNK